MIHVLYHPDLYQFRCERNPQTRCPVYRLTKLPIADPERRISVVAADVIQNTRTALDHLVQQLYLVANPGARTDKGISFFIGREHAAADYATALYGKIQGLRTQAKKEILAVQAYKGGKGHRLWVLNELNNIDKHRLLLTVDLHPPRLDVGAVMHKQLQAMRPDWTIPKMTIYVNPAKSEPLKVGDVIHIGPPDAECEKQIQFAPVVAFSEPGICEGQPVLEVLHDTLNLADSIIGAFRDDLV
jgi:hypothetical protein